MFDIFYIGKKPGLFPHERAADSISQAQDLSRTRYFWVVNYLVDYRDFDFLWEPTPWQSTQRHVWGSRWQKDSGTYLVPKEGYTDTNYHDAKLVTRPDMSLWENAESVEQFDFSWHPDYSDPPFNYEFGTQWQKTGGPRYTMQDATDTKYVSQSGTSVRALARHAYVIDHLDGHAQDTAQQIESHLPVAKISRFFDNYKDTLTRLANNAPEDQEYIWICSSICDYTRFDFSWHPEAWQNHMLHVFPSNEQKFGDTFFMHVPTFQTKIQEFELLDWYDINFVDGYSVARRSMPVIQHSKDSQIDAVKGAEWPGPLALFTTQDRLPNNLPTVSLWHAKTRNITALDKGGASVIVPRDAVPYVKTQLYDYPHVDKSHYMFKNRPLDIVFISNGESIADHNWNLLMRGKDPRNVLYRLDGVPGRVAAYQAAAELSQTDWFFAVFAKLQADADFDWSWQPDRMQQAKHYIFHAINPINELVYGHQAIIAYNRRLVLENPGTDLDFTLDQPHEVVPVISGVAWYHTDAWTCWRTAFREALKLRHSLPDVENEYRLREWLRPNNDDDLVRWSHIGAQDAMAYYDSVNGEFSELKKSYEWAWLASYARTIHPELVIESKT